MSALDRVKVRGNSPATKMRGQTGVVQEVLCIGYRKTLYDLRLDSGTRYDAWEDEVEAAPSKEESKVNIKKEDEIKIDPETGLPELPEGYRWRVTDEVLNPYAHLGHLYQKSDHKLRVVLEELGETPKTEITPNSAWRWWNFVQRTTEITYGVPIWRRLYDQETAEVSAEAVLVAAKKVFDRLDRVLKSDAAREGLIGVYPPKKLEVEA